MRLNQFLAKYTDLSRRSADTAISSGRVEINGILARLGDLVVDSDHVTLDGTEVVPEIEIVTILLNKPVGYVCSRNGQGSNTIYDLLPSKYHHLNPVGRLDKDSTGLLLMTNDGLLANQLTHPSYQKNKIYEVELNKSLSAKDRDQIQNPGVQLEDGISTFELDRISAYRWRITMHEGRNRQIRRTFELLGYKVNKLHRINFGQYQIGNLKIGEYSVIV